MVYPPFSAPHNFISALNPLPGKESHWFIFSGDRLLIRVDKKSLPQNHQFVLKRKLYLGHLENQNIYAGELESTESAPESWAWCQLRSLHGVLHETFYALAGRAMQFLHWDRINTYCGCCGNQTFQREHERCRECSTCGHLAYPKLSPAILALVKKEGKILLARSPHFPEKFYSILAGFVDPGETLEQCVEREVFEEVGLKVANIRYFGSQPWPFSCALMIGFTCEWESGEICIDAQEIEEASWFETTKLPKLPPPLSLARMLIDSKLH